MIRSDGSTLFRETSWSWFNGGSNKLPAISIPPPYSPAGDPVMALEAIHQGCRKSLIAHLLAAGWRPAGANKHALMTDYGLVALAPHFTGDELLGLDMIRRIRNTSDYDDPTATLAVQQLQGLITLALRFQRALADDLPTRISTR